jgi:hypothetical protein
MVEKAQLRNETYFTNENKTKIHTSSNNSHHSKYHRHFNNNNKNNNRIKYNLKIFKYNNKKLSYSSSHKSIKRLRYLFSLNCKAKPR